MANHLHWYTGGTIGGQDGTEIDITQPINLGAINTYSNIFTAAYAGDRTNSFYPLSAFPVFLRMETGYEIADGKLRCGYFDNNRNRFGALGHSNDNTGKLYNTETALKQDLDSDTFALGGITSGYSISITGENKITDKNCCLFVLMLVTNTETIGTIYPFDLIDFSFTETALG